MLLNERVYTQSDLEGSVAKTGEMRFDAEGGDKCDVRIGETRYDAEGCDNWGMMPRDVTK